MFLKPNWASGVEFKFMNPDDSLFVANDLRKKIHYNVSAWQEIDAALFQTIERDGKAIGLVVFIICLVACFNIIVTLSLTVLDRSKDIALLRALGATKSLIVAIFMVSGGLIGFFGALLGGLLGILLLSLFSGIRIGELQEFYFLEKIPVHFDLQFILLTALMAVFLSLLGSLYPAWKAARITPIQGLNV
ncbi:MAG: FtsX-like permease family protein [Silvanigrellaceae bacterium]|nr:FtsX-like permease family protein [Silvanigrellaceae bacterium]